MRAKHDSSFPAAVFDLQDVLITPKGYSKGFYLFKIKYVQLDNI